MIKQKRINLRVTSDEYKAIKQKVDKLKLSISEYIRLTILGKERREKIFR